MKRKNRFLVGALALSLTAVSAFGLAGCTSGDPDNKNARGGNNPSNQIEQPHSPQTQQQNGGASSQVAEINFQSAYDYSAIGGISLLNANLDNSGIATVSNISFANAQAPSISDAEKEKIFGNLAIAQNIVAGGVVKSEALQSDRAGYDVFYTISASDISGQDKVYSFYYNETRVADKDDDQDEKEYRLDGLVILDGVEYTMVGEREVEDNEEEFSFEISLDKNNKVVISQEKEGNQVEFEYVAYQNGKKVFETEVEYHALANGNLSLEFETFDKANGVNQEYKFEFFSQNGEQFAKVKVENGNTVETKAVVKIVANGDGSFSYQLQNPNASQQPNPQQNPQQASPASHVV